MRGSVVASYRSSIFDRGFTHPIPLPTVHYRAHCICHFKCNSKRRSSLSSESNDKLQCVVFSPPNERVTLYGRDALAGLSAIGLPITQTGGFSGIGLSDGCSLSWKMSGALRFLSYTKSITPSDESVRSLTFAVRIPYTVSCIVLWNSL